jgi:hypothetical protein
MGILSPEVVIAFAPREIPEERLTIKILTKRKKYRFRKIRDFLIIPGK